MKIRWWAACALVTGIAVASHGASLPAAGQPPAAVSASVKNERAPVETYNASPFSRRTTSGDIARGNLNARIDSLSGWAAHGGAGTGAGVEKQLVDALLSRTQYFGTYSDFDRALALVKVKGTTAAELDLWAAVQSSLHEFDAALAALAAAERADGKPRTAAVATIHLALGTDLEGVMDERRKAAREHPSYESLAGLAAALAAVGDYEGADAAYRNALAAYRDVSPFPVAWVEFQRGMMWAEMAGKPERAAPLYREAISRLPGYVVASVHLSEIEAEAGDRARAIERLVPLAHGEDPEPAAVLSKLLADSDPARAREYATIAKQGYERLLAKHRKAFLDHAAEFFAEGGKDPRRALAMALENLKLRPTDRAYTLAIRTALAAGDVAKACTLSSEAGESRPSVPLRNARRDASERCKTSAT